MAELEVAVERRPRHIAIIMDGNGRWAQRRGLPRIEGHRRGVSSVRRVVEECARLGLGQLTLYCLSSENWKRPRSELDFLMHLLEQYMIEERALIMKQNIRVRVIGRREGIAAAAMAEINKTIELSRKQHRNLLCAWPSTTAGGRNWWMRCAESRPRRPPERCRSTPSTNRPSARTCTPRACPIRILLIRTAGEMRMSNFLLWQISYAELWVTEKCWPEFQVEDLHLAIRDYAGRDRRFGGTEHLTTIDRMACHAALASVGGVCDPRSRCWPCSGSTTNGTRVVPASGSARWRLSSGCWLPRKSIS